MSRFKIQNSAFTNVVAGSVATLNVAVDRRYHRTVLEFWRGGALATWAQIVSDITLIELKINGRVLRSFKPSFLRAMQGLRGHVTPDGYIDLFFSEPWARTIEGEDGMAWAVKDQASTFQIDVHIASGVPTPALNAVSHVDSGRDVNGKLIQWLRAKRYTSQVVPVVATGIFTLNSLPVSGLYKGLYLFEDTAGDIASVRIKVDSVEVYNMTRAQAEASLPRDGVAQTGVFPVILDDGNRVAEGLGTHTPSGQLIPMEIEFEMAAANAFTLFAEYLGAPLQ